MSWPCPVCQKDFSRKDNLQRHMNSKHSDFNFAPVIPMSEEKCQRFQLVHPFTCMVAGMTGSRKTVRVQSLLQQAQTVIDQPPGGENNLVLFTVATRLHAIIDDNTDNRICPGISGK